MTTVSAKVGIAKMGGERFHRVEAVVDVWADHSVFPVAVLNELGIEPGCRQAVKLPDGSLDEWGYGIAMLEIDGQQWPCPVVFSPNDECRLGDSALQIFNIEPDYNTGELAPAGPILLGKPENPFAGKFARPTSVAPLDGYRIWLRYEDGVAGEIDLSHLAGKPAFWRWEDRRFFESVGIGDGGAVEWDEEVALCGDALYLELTGQVS